MSSDELQIDQLLASALRGEAAAWPVDWAGSERRAAVIERILYHGVAGLLVDNLGRLTGCPTEIIQRVRQQATAQAMWELRHREVLADLLASLANQGIVAILLKGTAVAYDLYRTPASRSRGDSDVVIAKADINRTRSSLRNLGYNRHPACEGRSDDVASQEIWTFSPEGETEHHIDLHWQLINAPTLGEILPFFECSANTMALPRLCSDARTMDHVRTLVHTCIHRTMHITAPYFVGGVAHHGDDRLIWMYDIHLLAGAMSEAEWQRLCALALRKGVSAVCLDGLATARRLLATAIPEWVSEELSSAPSDTQASNYLLHSRQFARSWRDLLTVPGLRRKFAYLSARSLPSAAFLRNKYPDMASLPIVLLHARRMIDLLLVRRARRVS